MAVSLTRHWCTWGSHLLGRLWQGADRLVPDLALKTTTETAVTSLSFHLSTLLSATSSLAYSLSWFGLIFIVGFIHQNMQTCSCHLVCTSCTGHVAGRQEWLSFPPCVATPALYITSVHPLPLSHFPSIFKDAISMYNPPSITTRFASLNSVMVHWICFAKANSGWSNAMTDVCEQQQA